MKDTLTEKIDSAFSCICEVCVEESKKHITSGKAVEKIRGYLDILNDDEYSKMTDIGLKVELQKVKQHEEEIRKQERLKVIAELTEFENEHRLRARVISEEYPTYNEEQKARLYALSSGRFEILEKLKQKLNEIKRETK